MRGPAVHERPRSERSGAFVAERVREGYLTVTYFGEL
jgi:hypothetical protein